MLVVIYAINFFVLSFNFTSGIKVKINQGLVIGTKEITVFDRRIYFAFYGIPYARPPLGKLRFKDPEPSTKWRQTFDASTVYHGACAQAHIVHKDRTYGFEDCLHLNIFTPSLPKDGENNLKPVIVWVHGYAFTSSFSHVHGGDFFVENDVLLVSVSYRLGPFGFLKINNNDTHSNMGLKDIIIALKWIRKNIKYFGGNKNKLTVMGSGSGATFLSLILTTKHHNLFSQVILQSGSLYSPSIFQSDQYLEKKRLLENLKLLGEHDIQEAKTENIIRASQKIYSNKEMVNYQRPVVPFTPSFEVVSNTSVLTKYTENIYKEKQAFHINKPIMIGFNNQESISEVLPFLHNPYLLKYFTESFKYMVPFSSGCRFNFTSETYKRVAEIIKKKYFHGNITTDSGDNLLMYSSHLHIYPIYKFIKNILATNNKQLFVYKFNYIGKFNAVKATSLAGINKKIKGASNGDEICYLLKCEPLWENYVKLNEQVNSRDKLFIKKIVELWSNFAKTGHPTSNNYKGNIEWLPASLEAENILYIGLNNKLLSNHKVEQKILEFWNKIYQDYYTNAHCNEEKHTEL